MAFFTRFRKKHIFRNKQYGIIPEQALNNLVKDPSKILIFNFSSKKQLYNFFGQIVIVFDLYAQHHDLYKKP